MGSVPIDRGFFWKKSYFFSAIIWRESAMLFIIKMKGTVIASHNAPMTIQSVRDISSSKNNNSTS